MSEHTQSTKRSPDHLAIAAAMRVVGALHTKPLSLEDAKHLVHAVRDLVEAIDLVRGRSVYDRARELVGNVEKARALDLFADVDELKTEMVAMSDRLDKIVALVDKQLAALVGELADQRRVLGHLARESAN
jgi:hypothetical protein